ncbi:MAG: hypothetical protein RE471_09090 [Ferroplasma sp.]|uniref:hypothetical protein n=1 Tax=Ferroplasma sp. TaxID=2591003 RepID=UPI002816773C|nr:hypothetical protein [Ferroplasma sp.]WMT51119.1 MAG: hypothetical protein RE471_09090 [Ferroplasma sp.]
MTKKRPTENASALLKSNIAQAIKTLYINRKVIYYRANRDYPKLSGAYSIFVENINNLVGSGALITVKFNSGFIYKKLDRELADAIIGFLDFLLIIPPDRYSIMKSRDTAIINEITVPKLSRILKTILQFKFPGYWVDKQPEYECIAVAILDIIRETTENIEVSNSIDNIKNRSRDIEKTNCINSYKNKINKWISMGFII